MEWNRERAIGRGSSATVWLGRALSSGEKFAVKSVQFSKSENLRRESEILSSLNSPRVIAYKGFDTSRGENGEKVCNLFMELARGGSLADELRHGGALSAAVVISAAREILLGLRYLHEQGIAHCDVKLANVLVTGEGLKIGDFGCARHVAGGDWVSFGGTPAYMAPEVARGEEQGMKADVWAFGCAVIEMLTGRVLWGDGLDPVSVLYRVGASGRGPEIPGFVSEEGRDFLGKCFKHEAGERWSASELLEHPFLVGEGIELQRFFVGSGLDVESPRSVLECSEFVGSSSGPGCESGPQRIRRLSGCKTSSFKGMDDWALEEGWVTVRDNWAQYEPILSPESDCGFVNEPISEKVTETIWCMRRDDLACLTIEFNLRNEGRKICSCGLTYIGIYWCLLNVSKAMHYCLIINNILLFIHNNVFLFFLVFLGSELD